MNAVKLLIPIFTVMVLLNCADINDALQYSIPENVNYNEHIEPIFRRSCIRCHGESEKIMNLDLSSYSIIEKIIGSDISFHLIVPGNPDSYLLRMTQPGGNMYIYLNDQYEFKLIEHWIVSNGAQ